MNSQGNADTNSSTKRALKVVSKTTVTNVGIINPIHRVSIEKPVHFKRTSYDRAFLEHLEELNRRLRAKRQREFQRLGSATGMLRRPNASKDELQTKVRTRTLTTGDGIMSLEVRMRSAIQKVLNYLGENRMHAWVKYFYRHYSKELQISAEDLLLALDLLLKEERIVRVFFRKENTFEWTVIYSLADHVYGVPQVHYGKKDVAVMDLDEKLQREFIRETEIQMSRNELRSRLGKGFLENHYRPPSGIDFF
jgi:hypothetical protein